MIKFGYNEKYMLKNNEPWFPIMGEIHYSRYQKEDWKESIYKMKAGGVQLVSCYTIWIHHEEIKGEYDFTGNKDLHEFVKVCKECGVYLMLRVGPWIHGEVRNGGFPDWLLQEDYEPRTNDSRYFAEVKKYYAKLYEQVEGYLLKDGGPIIGLQIENEYGHCGGLNGEEGEKHMVTLYKIAKEVGFIVPIYTATGWGGAVTGGLLPVMGGYCEAPWDQRLTEIEPSGNYIFTHERNDHNIGSDHGFGTGITFDIDKFPFLTAELGGGLQVTHHRRPVATGTDIGAMSLVKLGSGVNLLGYYMYHGGTNPYGKLSTLQETRATGYANDLPEMSYDFNAPIREYGQISDTFKEIKLLSTFISDFGSELCKMPAHIPSSNPLNQTNFTDLRSSIRHNGESGYLFINNYQRRYKMAEHNGVNITVELEKEEIRFPKFDVKDRDFFFYPFNMKIGNGLLKTALASPLCKLDNDETTYVFYTDKEPNYYFEGDISGTRIITLSKKEALNSYKITSEKEHLFISNSLVMKTNKGIEIIGSDLPTIKVYPDLDNTPNGFRPLEKEGDFYVYEYVNETKDIQLETVVITSSKERTVYEVNITYPGTSIKNAFLHINYGGDSGKVYLDNKLIADNFYTGQTWEVGLKNFGFPNKLTIEIYPLKEGDKVFLEEWPVMKDGVACEINNIIGRIEYHTIIQA